MSLSSLFFFGACWACYKLGAFNEHHPGEAWRRSIDAWRWVREWMERREP